MEGPGYKQNLDYTKVEEIEVSQAVGEMFVDGEAVLHMFGFIIVSVFADFLEILHQDSNQNNG